jgi:hypothetical protein
VAPKPEPARLAFVFGTVLAMAMIVAAMTTWAALPSPSAESIQSTGAIYQSQYLNLY